MAFSLVWTRNELKKEKLNDKLLKVAFKEITLNTIFAGITLAVAYQMIDTKVNSYQKNLKNGAEHRQAIPRNRGPAASRLVEMATGSGQGPTQDPRRAAGTGVRNS